MKKTTNELKNKTVVELNQEVQTLKEELSRLQLESKVKPPKDTNSLMKKKKRLAVTLTMLTEKIELEQIKKQTKKI